MDSKLIAALAVGLMAGTIAFAFVWFVGTGLQMNANTPAAIVGVLTAVGVIGVQTLWRRKPVL